MSDSTPEAGPPERSPASPAPRGRAGPVVAVLIAAAMIAGGDWFLRRRQQLVAGIAAHDVQVVLPFSETLTTRVERKTQYNQLIDRRAAALARHDNTAYAKDSYELAKFIESELSPEDSRRKQVMLEVTQALGDAPEAEDAFWSLLSPAWRGSLKPSYPSYAASLMKIAEKRGSAGAALLQQLASTLRNAGEPALELATLKTIRVTSGVTVSTADAMQRLLQILPAGDADRAALQSELAAYLKRREELVASLKWYGDFLTKAASPRPVDLETLRATAPKVDMNPFLASADAKMAEIYATSDRAADAARVRRAMAGYDAGNFVECDDLTNELAVEASPDPKKRPSRNMGAAPDEAAVQLCQWRGLLSLGKIAEADALASTLFANEPKPRKKAADEEKLAVTGDWAKLSPMLKLQNRTDAIPQELEGATEALYGTIALKPNGKVPPASIKCKVELWFSAEMGLAVITADEPRKPWPASKVTVRDQDVWKDECIELFFDPEHWVDCYYQIDANLAGTVYDAREVASGTVQRPQYKPNKAFDLAVSVKVNPTPAGWEMRLLFPRKPVFPQDASIIRFNVRRFRYVTERNQYVLHLYSWTGTGTANEHRPDLMGWASASK